MENREKLAITVALMCMSLFPILYLIMNITTWSHSILGGVQSHPTLTRSLSHVAHLTPMLSRCLSGVVDNVPTLSGTLTEQNFTQIPRTLSRTLSQSQQSILQLPRTLSRTLSQTCSRGAEEEPSAQTATMRWSYGYSYLLLFIVSVLITWVLSV